MYNRNHEDEVEENHKHDNGDLGMWHLVVLMIFTEFTDASMSQTMLA